MIFNLFRKDDEDYDMNCAFITKEELDLYGEEVPSHFSNIKNYVCNAVKNIFNWKEVKE